jgi:hypothetical protein
MLDKLIKSIADLSKKLIIEEGTYFPIIHYDFENDIHSATIANLSNDDFDLEKEIKSFVESKKIKNYVISEYDIIKNKKVIKLTVCIDNIEYESVFIIITIEEENVSFSDLVYYSDVN